MEQPVLTLEKERHPLVPMVAIPAGVFIMGSDEDEAASPAHKVYLHGFQIDATLVTNAQFERFVGDSGYKTAPAPSRRPGWRDFSTQARREHPVVYVSWHDAQAFARWAGKRLPTEAEWEKAARGGLETKQFPWGDELPTDQVVNWNKLQTKQDELPTTTVGSFPPNGYGLYDMAGNVWEWCADWYSDETYATIQTGNPAGPASGAYRVRRGASWNVREPFRLACSNRGAIPPDSYHPNVGFRFAR